MTLVLVTASCAASKLCLNDPLACLDLCSSVCFGHLDQDDYCCSEVSDYSICKYNKEVCDMMCGADCEYFEDHDLHCCEG